MTAALIDVALRIGQFQAMHYKWHYQRERPSQLLPTLLPPIDPPGHASFPSGHATESYLIAHFLTEVMPRAAGGSSGPPGQPPQQPPPTQPSPAAASLDPRSPLARMAQRIARNREVLGLHYPSDSEAGRVLAEKTFAIIANLINRPSLIGSMVADAKDEWR
jgi:membrane-associated phospholipid phosphatase